MSQRLRTDRDQALVTYPRYHVDLTYSRALAMFFGEVALDDALGARLAHSIATQDGRLRKGVLVDADVQRRLRNSDIVRITVARADRDEVDEDVAALAIAECMLTAGAAMLQCRAVGTGRVNLHALVDGLLVLDRAAIDRANTVDRALTVTTLAPDTLVRAGRMVATVKIIDYAVPGVALDAVCNALGPAAGDPPLAVQGWQARRAHLVQTTSTALRVSVLDKTSRTLADRLPRCRASLVGESRCAHTPEAVADTIRTVLDGKLAGSDPVLDWLLLVGATATSDQRDVIPAAIIALGGTIDRFGIPMDPGNLLVLGRLGTTVIIGLPGCARSPKDNGLDRVLARLATGSPCDSAWFASLGVGGLLNDDVDRPAPRAQPLPPAIPLSTTDGVTALVLAAGGSSRFGNANKLLHRWRGRTLLDHVLDALAQSPVQRVLVVTGHEPAAVHAILATRTVRPATVHNATWQSGLAGSLATGIGALIDQPAVLVCLGDMPLLHPQVIKDLLDAAVAAPDKTLVVPVSNARRGNPVLIRQNLFDQLLALDGDAGARVIAERQPDCVLEVPVGDAGVLRDVDTPGDVAALEV